MTTMPSPITVTFKDDRPVVTVEVDGPMTLDEAKDLGRHLLRATHEAQMIARSLDRPQGDGECPSCQSYVDKCPRCGRRKFPVEGSTVGEVQAS